MFIEYKKFWTEYTSTYGAKTAIFLQVGSFYEFYDVQEIKNNALKARRAMEQRSLLLILKRLINDNFYW